MNEKNLRTSDAQAHVENRWTEHLGWIVCRQLEQTSTPTKPKPRSNVFSGGLRIPKKEQESILLRRLLRSKRKSSYPAAVPGARAGWRGGRYSRRGRSLLFA